MATELLVLGGERTAPADGATSDVIEPGTGEPMAQVSDAGAEDARRAVDIAHQAFEEGAWPRMSATERGRVLLRASALLRERLEEFAVVESRNARQADQRRARRDRDRRERARVLGRRRQQDLRGDDPGERPPGSTSPCASRSACAR